MKLSVKVHPKARQEKVVKHSAGEFEVWVREAADKGKANEAVRIALGEYMGVAKSRLVLVSGAASRNKIFEIAR